MKHKTTTKQHRGFTLVELIVVMAVIALLAAVLIPTFAGVIERAHIAADRSLVTTANTAVAMDQALLYDRTRYTLADALLAVGEALTGVPGTVWDMQPETPGLEILYDEASDRFALVRMEGEEIAEVVQGAEDLSADRSDLWRMAEADELPADSDYSLCLPADYSGTASVTVSYGLADPAGLLEAVHYVPANESERLFLMGREETVPTAEAGVTVLSQGLVGPVYVYTAAPSAGNETTDPPPTGGDQTGPTDPPETALTCSFVWVAENTYRCEHCLDLTLTVNDDGMITAADVPDDLTVLSLPAEVVKENGSTLTVTGVAHGTDVDQGVFYNLGNVKSIILGPNMTEIGNYAFACVEGVSKLETLVISDRITKIGVSAFHYATNLRSVTLGRSLNTVDSAFTQCANIVEIINRGAEANSATVAPKALRVVNGADDSVVSALVEVDNFLFLTETNAGETVLLAYQGNDTELVLPTLEGEDYAIGEKAFYREAVTKIVIPDGVTRIASKAFNFCTSLCQVILSADVTQIGSDAFTRCADDLRIYTSGSSVPAGGSTWSDKFYFYSETSNTDGRHWHYVDGEPVVW